MAKTVVGYKYLDADEDKVKYAIQKRDITKNVDKIVGVTKHYTVWRLNELRRIKEVDYYDWDLVNKLCNNQWFHYYTSIEQAVKYYREHTNYSFPVLFKVEVGGRILNNPDKSGASKMKVISQVPFIWYVNQLEYYMLSDMSDDEYNVLMYISDDDVFRYAIMGLMAAHKLNPKKVKNITKEYEIYRTENGKTSNKKLNDIRDRLSQIKL